jgi:ferritin
MSAWCERMSFLGCAAWMRTQSAEEKSHAMKLYEFLADRNAVIELKPIPAPPVDFKSVRDMFDQALANEELVSEAINKLYELALEEKAYATAAELQWFLTEQVEEEKTARTIVKKLELIGDDGPALLELDRELGQRLPEEG